MKITPKNVVNLATILKDHANLERVQLNLNYNELDSDDLKSICDALEGAKLKEIDLSFKGCGLPRNAFKKLCIWLQLAVEVYQKLSLDFTMYD